QAARNSTDRRGEPLQPALLPAHDAGAATPALQPPALSRARHRSLSGDTLRRVRGALRAGSAPSPRAPARGRGRARTLPALPRPALVQLRGRMTYAIVSNGFADGPAQALRDYLVARGAHVVTVFHPLTPEQGTRHHIAR